MPAPATVASWRSRAEQCFYDLERFGFHLVASPRHADVLLVTGPVTVNMREALERTYAATPDPKWVVAGRLRAGRRGVRRRTPASAGWPRSFCRSIPGLIHPIPCSCWKALLALLPSGPIVVLPPTPSIWSIHDHYPFAELQRFKGLTPVVPGSAQVDPAEIIEFYLENERGYIIESPKSVVKKTMIVQPTFPKRIKNPALHETRPGHSLSAVWYRPARQAARRLYLSSCERDLLASITVGIVPAVPLSMALAIGGGVPPVWFIHRHRRWAADRPDRRLPLAMSRPTAAFIVILHPSPKNMVLAGWSPPVAVTGIIDRHGRGARMGKLIQFIPDR